MITLRATPSCVAGVGTVVAVTTTGSTTFVSALSTGFVSWAATGSAAKSHVRTRTLLAIRMTAPFLSKGCLLPCRDQVS